MSVVFGAEGVRVTKLWKKLYRQRWSIERLFRSVKHSRNLDQHRFRGMRKVELHATLSLLAYSATVVGPSERRRCPQNTTHARIGVLMSS